MLQSIRRLLEPAFLVVGAVSDGNQLIDAAITVRADVIVTDISMPGIDGIEAVRLLKQQGCESAVVFLTVHSARAVVEAAFATGAEGYVIKSRTQRPIYALQLLVSYDFASRSWLSIGWRQSFGGATTVNGVENDDSRRVSRLGAIMSMPIASRHTVKLAVTAPVVVSLGNDYYIAAMGWYHTW